MATSHDVTYDASALDLTEAEQATVILVAQSSDTVTEVEVWREYDGVMTIRVVDDGMTAIGWFDSDGSLRGDWAV